MFENIAKFFKKLRKEENKDSKETAKERLHLVLMQDRANVSADFMELMKQEIIEVIKKYIDVDENSIDVKLTNKVNNDGTTGAPILYANIPILNVKDDTKQINIERNVEKEKIEEKQEIEEKEQKEENIQQENINKEEKDEPKKVEKKSKQKKVKKEDNQEKEQIKEEKELVEENKEETKKLEQIEVK